MCVVYVWICVFVSKCVYLSVAHGALTQSVRIVTASIPESNPASQLRFSWSEMERYREHVQRWNKMERGTHLQDQIVVSTDIASFVVPLRMSFDFPSIVDSTTWHFPGTSIGQTVQQFRLLCSSRLIFTHSQDLTAPRRNSIPILMLWWSCSLLLLLGILGCVFSQKFGGSQSKYLEHARSCSCWL